jgi:cytidylate kinase
MENEAPFVISISRQKGCGGAYLGQRLASKLGMAYLDRELISEIAIKTNEPVEFIEQYDERIIPVWEQIIEALSGSNPWVYSPPPMHIPIFQVCKLESEIIVKIASEKSVVIVGRAASYLLRHHANHLSIFLYASKKIRIHRIQEVYGLSANEAEKLIEKADIDRDRYTKSVSGTNMSEATQYHLSLDTGVLGLGKTEYVALQYIRARFPDIVQATVGHL